MLAECLATLGGLLPPGAAAPIAHWAYQLCEVNAPAGHAGAVKALLTLAVRFKGPSDLAALLAVVKDVGLLVGEEEDEEGGWLLFSVVMAVLCCFLPWFFVLLSVASMPDANNASGRLRPPTYSPRLETRSVFVDCASMDY